MYKKLWKSIACVLCAFLTVMAAGCSSGDENAEGVLYIPEDGTVIEESALSGDKEALQEALNRREERIYVTGSLPLQWEDFYSLDYGAFWLKSYAFSSPATGRIRGESEDCIYRQYDLYYYDVTEEEISGMKKEFDDAVDSIAKMIPDTADLWEKAKTVHDELIRRVRYDHTLELPHCHDAYGALVLHEAVCSGYASAFSIVMEALGERCPAVVSETHAWNRVNALTYEEFIDVTWDDFDLDDSSGEPYIPYLYFGLTREQVESVDAHVIIGGDNASTEWIKDPVTFNYCGHEGFRLETYDEERITSVFRSQIQSGKNLLMVQFVHPEDYAIADAWWNGDMEAINRILGNAGFYGTYLYWKIPEVSTVLIGLNPQE